MLKDRSKATKRPSPTDTPKVISVVWSCGVGTDGTHLATCLPGRSFLIPVAHSQIIEELNFYKTYIFDIWIYSKVKESVLKLGFAGFAILPKSVEATDFWPISKYRGTISKSELQKHIYHLNLNTRAFRSSPFIPPLWTGCAVALTAKITGKPSRIQARCSKTAHCVHLAAKTPSLLASCVKIPCKWKFKRITWKFISLASQRDCKQGRHGTFFCPNGQSRCTRRPWL